MKKTIIALLVVAFLFLASASTVAAATYYIDDNGNDSNPGTGSAPFRTFARSMKALLPGDTLLVQDGVYTEPLTSSNPDVSKRVYFPSGAPGQPITIKSQNSLAAVIRPVGATNMIVLNNPSKPVRYLNIEGLVFDGSQMGNDHLVGVGIMISGKETDTSWVSDINFVNNEVRNIGKRIVDKIHTIDFNAKGTRLNDFPDYKNNYAFWSTAIMIKDCRNILVSGNYVHHNGVTDFDHGIYQFSENTIMENNIFFNNSGTGIKGGWSGGTSTKGVIRNNILYNNGMSQFFRGANGSVAGKKPRGLSSHFSEGYEYYNNIVFGRYSAGGIDIIYGPKSTKIYNNFVYNAQGPAIIIGSGAAQPGKWDVVGTLVRNNIAYTGHALYPAINIAHRSKDVVVENNLTTGANTQVNVDSEANNITSRNNVSGDPRFTSLPAEYLNPQKDISSVSAARSLRQVLQGLIPRSDSPLINRGVSLVEVQYDFNNVKRPQGGAYDIGPFEFGGTPSATQPPGGRSNTVQIVNVPLSSNQDGLGIDAIIDNGATHQGESSSNITYSSGWTTDSNSGYQEGRARWTRTSGATATYLTDSSSIQLRTKFESSTGSFDVLVNGAKIGNYKVNSSSTRFDTVTINLPVAATPSIKAGDANGDGRVDNEDYKVWLDEFRSKQGRRSDFDKNGRVDGVDYALWHINYGK